MFLIGLMNEVSEIIQKNLVPAVVVGLVSVTVVGMLFVFTIINGLA